ncbi:FAD-dependent oxidoreductase [Spirochaetia bacterium]|nr:FAD-dependent oxidoreductase [Spirochaetia bacterium]
MNCDILIIGAGPAGIFTALELLHRGSNKKIVMVEKGSPIEKRACPKAQTKKCMNCKPYCHITTGFSGAGAFSDGKLSLSADVGGDFPDLVGRDAAQDLIDYTDSIYLEFGATTQVEGLDTIEKAKNIRRRAIKAGLKLVDCPIRHLGTEKAQDIYRSIQTYLMDKGVEILFGAECTNLLLEHSKQVLSKQASLEQVPNVCRGAVFHRIGETASFEISAAATVVAAGRRGADWLERICQEHDILHESGTVDIGVRVEIRNEIMEEVNTVLYESKLIGYPQPFKDKVRTFCQNPGGFVSQENYDNNLAVVNGHSYKEMKSANTNLAILCSHNFSEPFNQPIAYAQKIGELTNMLGAGHILVQRYGDILDGKRTWQGELDRSNVKPTLADAVAGDITSAMPYRSMTNIINFMSAVDQVVPGFASAETLLYSPELKFYSNRVKLSPHLETNIAGLHCLGDSSGWTRGLMMASAMGVLMGRILD